jgi:hypothetical protein
MIFKEQQLRFLASGLGVQLIKPALFGSFDSIPNEETNKMSYLGTPVYSNLEIPAGEYKSLKGETIPFDGIRIDTVLFDINIEKVIVRTPINGRDGTVKQYISLGDYAISCQGIIIGESDATNAGFDMTETNVVPEAEIRKLNEIMKVPQEIEVVSEFLDFFGVSTVVIEGASFGQREGFRDSVFFSCGMLSDTPIELK